MKNLNFTIQCLVLFCTAALTAHAGVPQGRYIVVLANGNNSSQMATEVAIANGGKVGYVYEKALSGFSISLPRAAVAGIARDPRVLYVADDLPMSIVVQEIPTGITRIHTPADKTSLITTLNLNDAVDVDVAVLDTGIDFEHPDLNVVGGVSCLNTSGGGPPWSRNYVCLPGGDDDHYHGTHVAGTIAALHNDEGVVGVAPGARLWAVKVLDSAGSGYTSGIIAGIEWVIDQGDIEVLNMSLGGSGISTAYETAIDSAVAAGVVVVVAAGNSAADANNYSPAFVESAVTVSALADFDGIAGGNGAATCRSDQDDTLADFSNYGTVVDIAAPGVCIKSTYPLERGGYATISGTSMAAPHVAGAAALLASNGPPSSKQEVESLINVLLDSGKSNWTDDSGDGVLEPLLDITSFASPTLVSGGGGGTDPVDTTPPASPTGLSATAGDGVVQLEWSANTEGDLAGYKVYRDGDTEGVDVGDTNSYLDTDVANDTPYTYTVTAYDRSGNESGKSLSASATPTAAPSGSLTSSSTNNGKTWTAIVSCGSGCGETSFWSYNGSDSVSTCGTATDCQLDGIPKKQSQVYFHQGNTILTILKP